MLLGSSPTGVPLASTSAFALSPWPVLKLQATLIELFTLFILSMVRFEHTRGSCPGGQHQS